MSKLLKDENGKYYIEIPMKRDGNVYWKQRENTDDFGESFAPTENEYNDSCYAEWLIGYDVVKPSSKKRKKKKKKNKQKKTTSLAKEEFLFVGANDKEKYPYELSEILYEMIQEKLVSKDEIKDLIDIIKKQNNDTLDASHFIETKSKGDKDMGEISLRERTITLPTFVYRDKSFPGVSVEIVIQKQQKGSSTQPLLYFNIPITCLMNYKKKYIGKNYKDLSEDDQNGRLEINKNNKDYILKIFQLFSICSANHKHDVKEILSKLAQ